MHRLGFVGKLVVCTAVLMFNLAASRPAAAQDAASVLTLRQQYDAMMANFDRALTAQKESAGVSKVRAAREAMRGLTDQQLAALISRTHMPDLALMVTTTDFLATQAEAAPQSSPTASRLLLSNTPAFPAADPVVSDCDGVDVTAATRYAEFIAKEVANAILAAAAWACNEDILGENGSAACIPLAIAADIANGLFDTATFCAGEGTANQVDANFRRLAHIHDDLAEALTTIVNTSNANTAAIISNDNTNTSTIVTNDNVNRTLIVNNDNANLATILADASKNKNELRDLILRTQIEADLAMVDSAAIVELYALPNANGGYLDLVKTIVTETIARVQAAGGGVSNSLAFLNDANAAKAAGDFKGAYVLYRKAYKAAGK
ncbi:MAG: hypothetical protein ABIX28_23625 [Vicinamibacterales bacterium]